ncbi:LacI family transcriptional regulator [Microbacterium sp. Se63.02b]|nr:LacI family transcriptional regulator [Microbacterium sp. Se63.02b]
MGKKGVTLKDVAAVAGVSTSIVSRVLNGGGRVSPSTREAILEAAQRLDFRPNALAQYFALGRSFTVGLLTENSTGIFSMPVIAGIASELSRHDVAAMTYDDGREGAARAENIRKLPRATSTASSSSATGTRCRCDRSQPISTSPSSTRTGSPTPRPTRSSSRTIGWPDASPPSTCSRRGAAGSGTSPRTAPRMRWRTVWPVPTPCSPRRVSP